MDSYPITKEFLPRLDCHLQDHLSNTQLSVGKFLRIVGMSRTDLHRKLKASLGISTTEYIRQKRLEKAANVLINQPNWSICQVAQTVGFENQSYFTKCFKSKYGCCPNTWRTKE